MTGAIHGRPLVAGRASGITLHSDTPISLWGGLNPETGEIIDRRHPRSGTCVTGRILVVPQGRGSCSASGVLLEAIRNGTAPAGIVVSTVDPILGLGAILGDELIGVAVPVVLLTPEEWSTLPPDRLAEIDLDGTVTWESPGDESDARDGGGGSPGRPRLKTAG